MIVYIAGDNGSSAEGGPQGLAFEQSTITGQRKRLPNSPRIMTISVGPRSTTTFRPHGPGDEKSYLWWKQIASQAGGTGNGMVISWPTPVNDDYSVADSWMTGSIKKISINLH